MDLESQCSELESDSGTNRTDELAYVEEPKIENNGICTVQHFDNRKANGPWVNLSPSETKLQSSPSSATTKSHGLKKWRRIKRDVNKDGRNDVNDSKLLKRELSRPGAHSTKSVQISVETNQRNGISDFAAGIDSENSEERSSKTETAASAPKARCKVPLTAGPVSHKNSMTSSVEKKLGNSLQKAQPWKNKAEAFKKPRGAKVQIEKENSHSSIESDSLSSNYPFIRGNGSVIRDSSRRGMSPNYDREDRDEVQVGERQYSNGFQSEYERIEAKEFEDVTQNNSASDLSWKVKEERNENHASSIHQNPLDDSILALQSAQDALERELLKLKDIGKEDNLFKEDGSLPSDFTSVVPKVQEPTLSEQWHSSASGHEHSPSHSLETKVDLLESKLAEARSVLKIKDAKVIELEAMLDDGTRKEEEEIVMLLQQEHKEMLCELEGLFRQKIEVEIEYLATSVAVQNSRTTGDDHKDQAQMVKKLEHAEGKTTIHRKATESKKTGMDEKPNRRNSVCDTRCWLLLLIMLVLVLGFFILHWSHHIPEVVPT